MTSVNALSSKEFDGCSNLAPVRIGVVDTGVDVEHPVFNQKYLEGIWLRREGDDYRYEPAFHDFNGHGTAMVARIQAFCSVAQICAVRIAQQTNDGIAVRVQEQALEILQ